MPLLTQLPGYSRLRLVGSFDELAATPFADGVNALCWPRPLPGNFGEIVARLGPGKGVVPVDEARLAALDLGPAGRIARDLLLADLHQLRAQGLEPELNCIHDYPRDDAAAVVPTDVYSFHADSAAIEAATWLCTYHGPTSQVLRNEDAQRCVDIPAIHAALLKEYGGASEEGFKAFLREHCYDLHYVPRPHARPYSFGLGHLWRFAVDWPGSPVPPCIHRAPPTRPGEARLLLIS